MIYPEAEQRHSGVSAVFGVGIGIGGTGGTQNGPATGNGIWLQTGGPDFLLVSPPNSFFVQS